MNPGNRQQGRKIAHAESDKLKIAAARNRIAETNVKVAGSDRYPEITLFSVNNLQRSYSNSIPSDDNIEYS